MPCAARTLRRMRRALAVASASSRVSGSAVGVVELRQDQRVDPLGVRGPLDALRELRPHVLDERVAHARELPQVPVVREDDAGAVEVEGVQVRLGDDRLAGVGDAANVGDQTRRRELGREEAQVAVERRQGGRAVGERILGLEGRRVPRLHAEAREVQERVHHPRAVRLPDEAVLGVEQQVPHGERLTQVGQDPAHAPILLAVGPRGSRRPPDFGPTRIGREQGQEGRMKQFNCGDVVPGCTWVTRREGEEELFVEITLARARRPRDGRGSARGHGPHPRRRSPRSRRRRRQEGTRPYSRNVSSASVCGASSRP